MGSLGFLGARFLGAEASGVELGSLTWFFGLRPVIKMSVVSASRFKLNANEELPISCPFKFQLIWPKQ